jgi:hypothetical protein
VGNSAANIASVASVLSSTNSIGALGSTKFTGNVDYWKLESGFPMLEDLSIPLRESAMLECTYKEISSYNLALARGIDPNADIAATIEEVGSVTTSGTTTGSLAVTDAGGVVQDEWTVVFTGATAGAIFGKATGHVADFAAVDAEIAPDNGGNPYFSIPADFFSGTWAADETYVFKTTPFVAGTSAYADNHGGEIKLGAMAAPAFIRMEAVYTYPNGTNHMYIIFPRANVTSSTELDMQAEDAAAPPITFEAKRADSDTAGGDAAWDAMPLGRIYFD